MRLGNGRDVRLVAHLADLAAQQPTSTAVSTRAKGSPTAPVTVYEMSDFQCPYCTAAYPIVKRIRRESELRPLLLVATAWTT